MFNGWRGGGCCSPGGGGMVGGGWCANPGGGGKYSYWRRGVGSVIEVEFSRVTAVGKKLFLNLLVRVRRAL